MSYRYIGNKSRLVPQLLRELRHEAPSGAIIADLMCGTATVSEALRCAGYRVVASDLMTFAVHHARVRLLLDAPPAFTQLGDRSYFEVQCELNRLPGVEGLIFREYSPAGAPLTGHDPRAYFSPENARRIDAIRLRVGEWETNGNLTEVEASLLRHDLVLAANRVANIAGTYGHFRSKWNDAALAPLQLQPADIVPLCRTDHRVLQGRAEDLAEHVSANLCYLDPPYMKRQYAANYHLIETLARGDEPEAVGVSGLRPWRDQYSDFCSKLRIRDAFAQIIGRMDCPKFLVSYSEDGLLSKDDMLETLSRFGRVECREFSYQRFRSNNSPLGRQLREYLFYLRRN
jgi:adenine-specific DNA-methyltransferase